MHLWEFNSIALGNAKIVFNADLSERSRVKKAIYSTLAGNRKCYHEILHTLMRVVKNSYTMGCPPAWEITHLLKLIDYLLVQADKPWYNYCFVDYHLDAAKM